MSTVRISKEEYRAIIISTKTLSLFLFMHAFRILKFHIMLVIKYITYVLIFIFERNMSLKNPVWTYLYTLISFQ